MATSKTPLRLETSETPEGDDRLAQLERENERLRGVIAHLESAGARTPAAPSEPSFGVSEGIRDDIERNGSAVSPFTGDTLTREDLKG